MVWSDITFEPIEPASVLERVGGPEDGASVLFLGVVRNRNEGRAVSGMEYEAYQAMARRQLAAIGSEAANRTGVRRVAAVHRLGELSAGEGSVAVAASSPHRAEAFDAARRVIEEVKKRLPVWKREHYVDGEPEWLAGQAVAVADAESGPATPRAAPADALAGDAE